MLPNPLHPAVVHVPLAIAVLLPFFSLGALLAIRRGVRTGSVWGLVVALHAVLAASAWLAVETGEDQEELVERVVAQRYIEEHGEAAERFLLLAGLALVVSSTGLLGGRGGRVGRALGFLSTAVLLGTAVQVGRLGGELVYEHGAAQAYARGAAGARGAQAPAALEGGGEISGPGREEREDDD